MATGQTNVYDHHPKVIYKFQQLLRTCLPVMRLGQVSKPWRHDGNIVAAELVDSFYAFRGEALAAWYAFGYVSEVCEPGIATVTNDFDDAVALSATSPVCVGMATPIMEGSWSTFFIHSTIVHAMVLAIVRMGVSCEHAYNLIAVDGQVSPRVALNGPTLCPCVDHANALCWVRADADYFRGHLRTTLDEWGVAYRAGCSAGLRWDTIERSLRLRERLLLDMPLRMWRARGAVFAVWRHCACSYEVLKVLVGRVAYCAPIWCTILSVLSAVYGFIRQHGPRVVPLSAEVLDELWFVASLVPSMACDLGASEAPVTSVSDASQRGYTLFAGRFSDSGLEALVEPRERKRFKPERDGPPPKFAADARLSRYLYTPRKRFSMPHSPSGETRLSAGTSPSRMSMTSTMVVTVMPGMIFPVPWSTISCSISTQMATTRVRDAWRSLVWTPVRWADVSPGGSTVLVLFQASLRMSSRPSEGDASRLAPGGTTPPYICCRVVLHWCALSYGGGGQVCTKCGVAGPLCGSPPRRFARAPRCSGG